MLVNSKPANYGVSTAKDNFKETAQLQAKLQHQTNVNDNLRKELF